MNKLFHPYDITKESDMKQPLDFNRKLPLKNVDKVFKSEITNIIRLTEMEKLFQIRIIDETERENFEFRAGQFVMVELPGYGEVPISISASPSNKGYLELCIRKAGLVTNALHKAKRKAVIGIRGPFGTHFPIEQLKGNDVLLIAGGLGLAPLRSAILNIIENRVDFRKVNILYGAKQPDQLLFNYQYDYY